MFYFAWTLSSLHLFVVAVLRISDMLDVVLLTYYQHKLVCEILGINLVIFLSENINESPTTFDSINRELNFDCTWGGRLSRQSWLFLAFSEEATKAGRPLCIKLLFLLWWSLWVIVLAQSVRQSVSCLFFLFYFIHFSPPKTFFFLAGIYIGHQL